MAKDIQLDFINQYIWRGHFDACRISVALQYDVRSYAMICSIIAILAIVLAMLLVIDPPATLE